MARQARQSVFQRVEALPIILVFVLLLLLFMYLSPQVFLQPFQYTTFLSTLPPVMLLAIGLTFIIGAGEIDLCFPAIIGFSGFIFAVIFKEGPDWLVATLGAEEGDWAAGFTQEWPAPGMRHQLSYTVPFASFAGRQGVGDVLINYRYQAMEENGRRPAFSPRLSVILPTGGEEDRDLSHRRRVEAGAIGSVVGAVEGQLLAVEEAPHDL